MSRVSTILSAGTGVYTTLLVLSDPWQREDEILTRPSELVMAMTCRRRNGGLVVALEPFLTACRLAHTAAGFPKQGRYAKRSWHGPKLHVLELDLHCDFLVWRLCRRVPGRPGGASRL